VNGTLHAWASTIPDDRPTMPNPGDACAVATCPELLADDEEVYAVIEIPTQAAAGSVQRGEWVCWRHIWRESGTTYPVGVEPTT
jgi:hypothetical protein